MRLAYVFASGVAVIALALPSTSAASGTSTRSAKPTPYALLRGRAILFATDGVGHRPGLYRSPTDIYLLAPSAPRVRNLTRSLADETEPAWSPDGRRIVFVRRVRLDGHHQSDLFVMNADSTGERRLTATPELDESEPAWSPDGSQIAFTDWSTNLTHHSLYVMSVIGGKPRRIVVGSPYRFPRHPDWSPDGSRIAYERVVYAGLAAPTSAIYVVDANGEHARRLTRGATMDGEPAWSPSGETIIFGRERILRDDSACASSIWAVTPSGNSVRNLTKTPCNAVFGDSTPAWSWDGQAFAAISGRGNVPAIAVFRRDGSHRSVLLERSSFTGGLAWQPSVRS